MKQLISNFFIILLFCTTLSFSSYAKNYMVFSPDKKISVEVSVTDKIVFNISFDNHLLLKSGTIALHLTNETLGEAPKVLKTKKGTVNETIKPVVPLKFSELKNNYNYLTLSFNKNFQVEFRVFNNGAAYRFITNKDHEITILNEIADFVFNDNYKSFLSKTEFKYSNYEHLYKPVWLQDLTSKDLAILPIFLNAGNARILIAEADLIDYPALFMNGAEGNHLKGWQPKYPEKTEKIVGSWWHDRRLQITKEADYIAKTEGNRTFPWRIFTIGINDKDIVTSNLVYLLASPSKYKDTDWIEPGQTSWEWWHASNIIGIDFKSGLNTNTYKYYIDFASKYGMKYVLLDEGWSKSVLNILEPNPDIDLDELISYAKKKNVKVILWASWLAVENTPEFFKFIHNKGVAGVKIDFMDRSDQWMMNYYERTAKKAFENRLLVDFHGSITPRGLERAYPNIISYEGVTGMEQNKSGGFDTPNNHVILPFTRNVAGPMDYTPGAMKSVHPKYWHANWTNPMSIGTRAHQMALFVVFESGLQMLADNPSDYYREDECTRFITSVPTVWDETVVVSGKTGEHIIVAKRKDNEWFIGGITNDETREVIVDLSFLQKNTTYNMIIFKDGINADKYAIDYKKEQKKVSSDDKLNIKMIFNGGFAARLVPE